MDFWREQFRLEENAIVALTEVGEITADILRFNSIDRVIERNALVDVGRYPSPAALRRIRGQAGA